MISRTHFARFMVESGYAQVHARRVHRYLGDGKPGYVVASLVETGGRGRLDQGGGRRGGGRASGRYDYSPVEFAAFFDEFIELGGKAIEVVTGSHTPDQYREYADVARRFGFYASRGSDFHARRRGPHRPRQLPPLPSDLKPVWERWL